MLQKCYKIIGQCNIIVINKFLYILYIFACLKMEDNMKKYIKKSLFAIIIMLVMMSASNAYASENFNQKPEVIEQTADEKLSTQISENQKFIQRYNKKVKKYRKLEKKDPLTNKSEDLFLKENQNLFQKFFGIFNLRNMFGFIDNCSLNCRIICEIFIHN